MKIKYTLIISTLFIIAVVIASLAGCSSETIATMTSQTTSALTTTSSISLPAINLNVSAAASLTDALTAIDNLYMQEMNNVTIIQNFAASGTLQKQIEQGAPADVFISAASKQMDALKHRRINNR